ncbi:hypothetical protein Ancab_004363 [Ancistrocladus abbreviatus]
MGGERLKLFKADLQKEGSFDEAVKGCDGVFHVAASMEFSVPPQENVESYVQSKIIDTAIRGTVNVLKSCLKSKSVRRVVFTSSISTITGKDDTGNWRDEINESCRTPVNHVWNTRESGWVYVLSKLLTEEAATQFAKSNGIHLISVISTTVGGPFLTSTVPSSIRVLLSPMTGDPDLLPILTAVNTRMGSICLVHIEDICNAHVFLMQHPTAVGPYMCCAHSCHMSQLLCLLAQAYQSSNIERIASGVYGKVPSEISSKKLKDLGFEYEYGLEDIINHTISHCTECGYLPPNKM